MQCAFVLHLRLAAVNFGSGALAGDSAFFNLTQSWLSQTVSALAQLGFAKEADKTHGEAVLPLHDITNKGSGKA